MDENPSAWVEKNFPQPDVNAQPEAVAPPVAPAEPAAAEPANWWEDGLAEAKHGFLKNRKGPEVENAFRHAETAKQTAERERNVARDEANRLRQELLSKEVALQMAAEERRRATQPPVDPYDEIESLWFENPKAAAAKLREIVVAESRQNISQETERMRMAQQTESQNAALRQEVNRVYDVTRERLNLTPETWNRRFKAVYVEATDPKGQYADRGGPLNPDNLIAIYNDIYGDLPAAALPATAPPPPPAANPPGSARPRAVTQPPNAGLPTLSTEKRAALEMVAGSMGFDKDKYIARYLAEEAKGANRG